MLFTAAPCPEMRGSIRQIVGVDAIRCLAAIFVMIFHLSYWIWAGMQFHPGLGGSTPVDYVWLAPFTSFGWVGVQVFFVISGFVIIYSAQNATPFRFFRSRFLRLVPAAWICASITAAALLLSGTGYTTQGGLATAWLKAVTFYPFRGWIDNAYWTLGIELAFYAVVFLVIASGMFRRIYWLVGLIGMVSSLFWFTAFAVEILFGSHGVTRVAIFRLTDLLLLQHGCLFALGAFVCLAHSRRLNRLELGCLLAFVVGGLLEIRWEAHLVDALAASHRPAVIPMVVWSLCVLAIAASVRWNSLLAGFGPGFVAGMRAIGLLTYPLYLVHQFVGYVIIDTLRKYVADSAALIIAIAVCLLLALLISRFLEPAVRTVLARWLNWVHARAIGGWQRA